MEPTKAFFAIYLSAVVAAFAALVVAEVRRHG